MDDLLETPGAQASSSPVDGMLVRLIDGELSGIARAEALALLESSPEIRRRMGKLRSESDLFSDLLADLPIPQTPDPRFPFDVGPSGTEGESLPPMGPGATADRKSGDPSPTGEPAFAFHTYLFRHRIAAGLVLLLVSLSLFRPVRAWIVENAGTLFSVVAPREARTDSGREFEGGSSRVSFVPMGNEFLISVQAVQVSGHLTVVVVEGPRAFGEILGEGTGIDLLVLPGGIEVRNGPGSTAEYRVGVPRSLHRVRIRLGGRDLGIHGLDGTRVGDSWSFELSDTDA